MLVQSKLPGAVAPTLELCQKSSGTLGQGRTLGKQKSQMNQGIAYREMQKGVGGAGQRP